MTRFHFNRLLAAKNNSHELSRSLDAPLCPAVLLGLEGIHVYRDFRRCYHPGEKNKLPPLSCAR